MVERPGTNSPEGVREPRSADADINNQPGRTFKKSTQTYVQQFNMRTVLVKDPNRAIGFYVLTSFPTP